jgi:hypothetical protein
MPRPPLLLLLLLLLRVDAARADSCDDDCASVSCLPEWWREQKAPQLVVAAVLVFFATFLPRVLVRLLIFVFTKLPFMHQYRDLSLILYCHATVVPNWCAVVHARLAEDFRESCVGSTSYLISMSLVLLALTVSKLLKFFCHLPTYIWGVFFLYWLYSLFNVVQSVRPRRRWIKFLLTIGDSRQLICC